MGLEDLTPGLELLKIRRECQPFRPFNVFVPSFEKAASPCKANAQPAPARTSFPKQNTAAGKELRIQELRSKPPFSASRGLRQSTNMASANVNCSNRKGVTCADLRTNSHSLNSLRLLQENVILPNTPQSHIIGSLFHHFFDACHGPRFSTEMADSCPEPKAST